MIFRPCPFQCTDDGQVEWMIEKRLRLGWHGPSEDKVSGAAYRI